MLEALVVAGVVATTKKAGGGAGEGAVPLPQCKSSIAALSPYWEILYQQASPPLGSYLSTRELPRGPADQGTKGPSQLILILICYV